MLETDVRLCSDVYTSKFIYDDALLPYHDGLGYMYDVSIFLYFLLIEMNIHDVPPADVRGGWSEGTTPLLLAHVWWGRDRAACR